MANYNRVRQAEYGIARKVRAESEVGETCHAMDSRIVAEIKKAFNVERTVKTVRNWRSIMGLKYSLRPKLFPESMNKVPGISTENGYIKAEPKVESSKFGASGFVYVEDTPIVEISKKIHWRDQFPALLSLVFELSDEGLEELLELVGYEKKRREYLGK